MSAPTPDSPVRMRLKCSDAEDFVDKFAANVTRGGIFLPTLDQREVGAAIRFELSLEDGELVFAGDGVVTWAKVQGMGVKFTTLDPKSAPMLERLLARREARKTQEHAAEAPAAAAPPPAPETARRSSKGRFLVLASVAGMLAIVGVSFGRGHLGARSSPAPAAPAKAPPPPVKPIVEEIAPPPPPAPEAVAPAETAAPPAQAAAGPMIARGGLRVENVLVGPTYQRFTCPAPTSTFSVRSHKTVNVCLEVAHRPERTDRLTLIWERNGEFAGNTSIQIPASRENLRTRAHMKLGKSRLGSWSVRIVSERKVTLAQAAFAVEP